jgi:hypothetical protein
MKVTVVNRTKYATGPLQRAFQAALAAFRFESGKRPHLTVLPTYYSRTDDGLRLAALGRADCPGWRVDMLAASPARAKRVRGGIADDLEWAIWLWTLEHEVMHLQGCEHGADYSGHERRRSAAIYGCAMNAPPDDWESAKPKWARGINRPAYNARR